MQCSVNWTKLVLSFHITKPDVYKRQTLYKKCFHLTLSIDNVFASLQPKLLSLKMFPISPSQVSYGLSLFLLPPDFASQTFFTILSLTILCMCPHQHSCLCSIKSRIDITSRSSLICVFLTLVFLVTPTTLLR